MWLLSIFYTEQFINSIFSPTVTFKGVFLCPNSHVGLCIKNFLNQILTNFLLSNYVPSKSETEIERLHS